MGLLRRISGITVCVVGCSVLVATAGAADWAEAQVQVPDLSGCPGPLATRYLKLHKVPFDVVGDAGLFVVGQDGGANHVTLVFDDADPSLPECSVVEVPDVVGLGLDEAVDLIAKAGLVEKAKGRGTVEQQDPRARWIVERGSTVSLVVGGGGPAGEQPGGVAGEAGGGGTGEAELPAGDAPAAGSEVTADRDPAGGDAAAGEPAGGEPAGGDRPGGAEPAEAGETGGDRGPESTTHWSSTAALLGAIGVTLAAALALLVRARPGFRRRQAAGRAGSDPRQPRVPARVRLVPHDVASAMVGPDGGPPVTVTASLDEADLVVRVEEEVSS